MRILGALVVIGCSSNSPTAMPDASGDAVAIDAPAMVDAANGSAAAAATAMNNALCAAITPFYWEIGDATAALASGSIGVDASAKPVLATTRLSIASASKWIYGTYVAQLRAGALTADDVNFLHFTSGYTNMGSESATSECPATDTPDDVNSCLALINSANGMSYGTQIAATTGEFDYDGGHLENHASLYGGLGTVVVGQLGPTIGAMLDPDVALTYTEPLLAGGIYTSSNDYALVLRRILDGTLAMHDLLGANPVCTRKSASCTAATSPIPEAWHYSMAHWVEDDPATNGDGALSSAGAFGFYPWIEASKQFYGVISRQSPSGQGVQNGYASAQCGRLIRRAWDTGVEQTGAIPN
jgi:hypothetical protein